ncbi:hypothetical protein C7M84_017507 [Penaeus vannamei]|uniref:Arrestin-like N-terminal domain-containing protein n=1 Tax=Penaeus vannamei TaxID=6689 RepID=A0A3R7SKB1_PENVA|nr:hypothetical protein C7M84_017507 [Penaeus vannamei]
MVEGGRGRWWEGRGEGYGEGGQFRVNLGRLYGYCAGLFFVVFQRGQKTSFPHISPSLSQADKDSTTPLQSMVFSFHVYRKSAPNGKVSVYVGRRDYTDHLTHVDPINGMVWLDRDYVRERRVFAQVVMTYRYGREEDEVMGLTFAKELIIASAQVYPPAPASAPLTSLQVRLQKKLGANAFPFHLEMPKNAPASVTLQPGQWNAVWLMHIFV